MQIVSGRFKPDDKLPAEALLCEEYAVSRPVLREATRVLVAKGLVYFAPARGHGGQGSAGVAHARPGCAALADAEQPAE